MPSNQIPSFFTSKKMRKAHGFPENDRQMSGESPHLWKRLEGT